MIIGQSEVNLIVSGAGGVASDFPLHMEIGRVKLPNLLKMTPHLHCMSIEDVSAFRMAGQYIFSMFMPRTCMRNA